jgi:hypothetical protein
MTAASSTTEVDATLEKDMKNIKDDVTTPKEQEDPSLSKDVEDVKEQGEQSNDQEYPPLAKVIVIILALYLAVFLVALDQTIIGVAIPKITDQFKSISDIAWYGSAYFLTSTALQPSYGRIYKIFSVSCQHQSHQPTPANQRLFMQSRLNGPS